MIPQWVAGAAARDTMLRPPIRGGSSSGGHGFRGVFSFLGIVLMLVATFMQALQAHLGGFLACAFAALIGFAGYWAAYRAQGALRFVPGLGVPAFSAYALYVLNSEGASWFWPIALFVAVGIDQFMLKQERR